MSLWTQFVKDNIKQKYVQLLTLNITLSYIMHINTFYFTSSEFGERDSFVQFKKQNKQAVSALGQKV